MKNDHHLPAWRAVIIGIFAGGMSLALAGCETVGGTARQERIAAHPAALATLAPEVQGRVAAGNVKDGDTFEAIFLALGMPDRVETTADGGETLWIYKKFYHTVGINGTKLFDAAGKRSGPAPAFPTGARPDYMPQKVAPLRGSALTTKDYARQNSHNGNELPPPPRESPEREVPPLPSVELEILFRGHQVATIQVIPEGLAR